jgi:carboxyl-terminal processing protease
MNSLKTYFIVSLLVVTSLVWGFIGGLFADNYLRLPWIGGSSDFSVLKEAYLILLDNGLNDPPQDPALEYGMIRGMLNAYGDPFSSFAEPIQSELNSNRLQGSFGGIGARMGTDIDGNILLYPYPDSPARSAGILDGDHLLKVGELVIEPNNPLDPVLAAVRGPVGQSVTLTVGSPPDYIPRIVNISRMEVSLPSVTWHLNENEPRLGIIEINIIAETTPSEVQKAVADLSERGASHFVLDLRNNGGGLLNSGVDTARLFLKDGEVMRQQYRGRDQEIHRVNNPGPLADIPLAVMVNTYTASSAEIIAGALQANQRAALIGVPTFGKNTIQLVFTLQDDSTLHITSAEWWFLGLDFPRDGKGLYPDIEVPEEGEAPLAPIQAAIDHFFPEE